MASLNKVLIIGNLTRDPETRYTPSGSPVTQLRLAVNRRYRDRENNWRDDTVFLDVEIWGRQAETLGQSLKKGSTVFVDGRLKMDEWTSKDGTRRSKLVVVAIWATPIARSGAKRAPSSEEVPDEGNTHSEGNTQEDFGPEDEGAAEDARDDIAPEEDEPPF